MSKSVIGPAAVFDALEGGGYGVELMREEVQHSPLSPSGTYVFDKDGVVVAARDIAHGEGWVKSKRDEDAVRPGPS